jgi:hypothetical protein
MKWRYDMDSLIYLDNYVLQQDMRIRLPKAILSNLNAEKGVTRFNIFFDSQNKFIVLKPEEENDSDR